MTRSILKQWFAPFVPFKVMRCWSILWIVLRISECRGLGFDSVATVKGGEEMVHTTADASNRDSDNDSDRDNYNVRSLIIAGTNVSGLVYPSFVQPLNNACGGVLVAPDVVLTAAHCVGSWSGTIVVGSNVRSSTANGAKVSTVTGGMHVHPQFRFDATTVRPFYDFMLFTIQPTTLQPATLNFDPLVPIDGQQNLTVVGYGQTDPNNTTRPTRLQKTTVRTINHTLCQSLWDADEEKVQDDIMWCAVGATQNVSGPCFGDSGGPVYDSSNNVVGLVSWGRRDAAGCGQPDYPAVYARISYAYDWIRDTICKISNSSDLSYCSPDIRCPPDATLLEFPNATLTSATSKTKLLNASWVGATIAQTPSVGTKLAAGTITAVTVSATDGTGNKLSCNWTVKVPPLEFLGGVVARMPKGSSSRTVHVIMNLPGAVGFIQKLQGGPKSGRLNGRKVIGRLLVGSRFKRELTVKNREKAKFLTYPNPSKFTEQSSFSVRIDSKGFVNATRVFFDVWGQKKFI